MVLFMKVLMIPLFLLSALTCFAQEKFIQVTVVDTAWVKPDNFLYRISVNTEEEDAVLDTLAYTDAALFKQRRKQKEIIQKKAFDAFRQVLQKKGFRILAPGMEEAYLTAAVIDSKKTSLLVITRSIDSLATLFSIVSADQSLEGYMESAFASDESPYYNNLYKKLLAQATKNATVIAGLSDRKIGKIISVTESAEDKNPNSGGWTLYPPLSVIAGNAVPGWHTTIKGRALYNLNGDQLVTPYLIYNSLTVRFEFE